MNPLRIDNKPGADTCHVVRSVLTFMVDALVALDASADRGDLLSEGGLFGASQIIGVCADALKEADDEQSEVQP